MTQNQKTAPQLSEALDTYAHRAAARFHMPGHKGRGMGGFFHDRSAEWDITELSFSDNLHDPAHIIARAQNTYAHACGAAHTFFLVNGATAGLLAMMLSLPPGSNILISRDCHRSALSGVALAGHNCAFLPVSYCEENDLWGCVTPEVVEEALNKRHADALLITSPNYYGHCADIPAISEITHKMRAKLFVDAAHGAHFPFSDALPDSPAGYADAWVHSAHKTLNALGQAALLHIGDHSETVAMQRTLSLVQTSSPSYLLMASLDWARYTAGLQDAWTVHVQTCQMLCKEIASIAGIRILGHSLVGRAGIVDMDCTRLSIDVTGRGLTGYAAKLHLEKEGVFVEMADQRRLVLISTPSDDPVWHAKLSGSLDRLPYEKNRAPVGALAPPPLPEAVVPVAQAARSPMAYLPLNEARDHIAGEAVGVYPPGIPLWAPGEHIDAACIEYLSAQQRLGADTFGVHDGDVAVVNG